MKTIICLILTAILLPGQGFDPVRVPFLRTQTGLVRAGLVGGWDLRTVNLLSWSEDFSRWNGQYGTMAHGLLDPSGGFTASSMANGSYSGIYRTPVVAWTNGMVVTLSVWARGEVGGETLIMGTDSADGYSNSAKTLTTSWARYTHTGTNGTSTVNPTILYCSTNPGKIYIAFAQLNAGPVALPYVRTTDQQRIPAIQSQVRYANGSTELVGNRTNLLKWSEDFSNGVWEKSASTVTANYGVAPDGTTTASRVQFLGINTVFGQTTGSIPAGTYSGLVYVKGAPGETILIGITTWSPVLSGDSLFTLSGGWDKITLAAMTSTSPSAVTLNTSTYGGATARDIQIWHPQLSPGPTPSTYIKTEGDPIEPGYPWLVRGTTTSADTNDPTPGAVGDTLVTDDRYMAIAAKDAAWTTVNCSEANCYGVDSAGGSYVNGAKTAGAAEWSIFTAGGYNGKLSTLYRYNRVLNPREHRQLYQWTKARVNGVGGQLP